MMTLNFPNRFIWLVIGAIMLFLLQSGCQPIQPPADQLPAEIQPTAIAEEEARANLSTYINQETRSPDGQWTATTLFQIPRGSETFYQSLVVTHASGAPSYTLIDGEFPLGLGYTVAEPLTWSQDGARFYFTNRPQADGCALLFNGSDLHVLDLASGETNEVLPADTTTTIGLAPDEQHVAYLAMGQPTLVLRDLASDISTKFDLTPLLDNAQIGAFIWSSDSTQVAFVVAHGPCVGGWAEATSIYTLDTDTLTLTAHLESDDRLLSPVAWPTDATLTLENRDGETFTLDPATNEISQ